MRVNVSKEIFDEGMKPSDFEVGKTFWTATGQWVVNEIDGEVIYATRVNGINQMMARFDSDDFGGCYPTKEKMEEDV